MMQSTARKTGTRPNRQSITCHHCGATNYIEEPWKKWIRNNPQLDSTKYGISLTDTQSAVEGGGALPDPLHQFALRVNELTCQCPRFVGCNGAA